MNHFSFLSALLVSFLVVSPAVQADSSNTVIRVRLLKELSEFPVVPRARVKAISERVWSMEGNQLVYADKKLSSKNYILRKDNGRYDLIGLFNFNTYLAGVVSKEMPLSWPLEALKAQAVAARSFALARMEERKNKAFHLDTDQMDQVFEVTASEKAHQAVALTNNIILKDRKNRILKAFYHADCGGQTVPASKVWNESIDTGTAVDPWCAQRSSNEWVARISKKDFYQKMQMETFEIGVEEAKLEAAESFKSRIQSFTFLNEVFPVQKFRQLFGFSLIRNSPLSIAETDSFIELKGKGYGHGAGLCQWGTLAQAKKGRSFTQVLEHYYPQASISQESLKLTKNFLSDLVFN